MRWEEVLLASEERHKQWFARAWTENRYAFTSQGQSAVQNTAHHAAKEWVRTQDVEARTTGEAIFYRLFGESIGEKTPLEGPFVAFFIASEVMLMKAIRDTNLQDAVETVGHALAKEDLLRQAERHFGSRKQARGFASWKGSYRDIKRTDAWNYFKLSYDDLLLRMKKRASDFGLDFEIEFISEREQAALAGFVVGWLLDHSDLFRVYATGHRRHFLTLTDEAMEWFKGAEDYIAVSRVSERPCFTPPVPWTGFRQGGYPSSSKSIIGTLTEWPHPFTTECDLLPALNRLQENGWLLDRDNAMTVIEEWDKGVSALPNEVMRPVQRIERYRDLASQLSQSRRTKRLDPEAWDHAEHERIVGDMRDLKACANRDARMQGMMSQTREMLLQSGEGPYFFSWRGDHRGRMYQSGGVLRFQGSDYARSLWMFQGGHPTENDCSETLYNALALQLTALAGDGYAKQSRVERFACLEELVDTPEPWQGASEPYQFRRLRDALERDDRDTLKHMPVSLDASAHGLQLIAAVMGDKKLAEDTSLVGGTSDYEPFIDFYGKLAEGLYESCEEVAKDYAEKKDAAERYTKAMRFLDRWFEHIPMRKWVKRLVVAFMYGSRPAMRIDAVANDFRLLVHGKADLKELAAVINTVAWVFVYAVYNRFHDSYPSVRQYQFICRKWMYHMHDTWGDSFGKLGVRMPSGFVYNPARFDRETTTVDLGLTRTINMEKPSTVIASRRRNAESASANFIHALEASIVQTIVKEWSGPIATVHDCFYTTPYRLFDLERLIRSTYTKVLTASNPLHDAILASCGDAGYAFIPAEGADAVLASDGSNMSRNFLS